MKVYEVKRDGVTVLCNEQKDGDVLIRELDAPDEPELPGELELEDGDYVLHIEHGEVTWRRRDDT